MFPFLQPALDSTEKIPDHRIKSSYRWHQTGVLAALCLGYIGYYIIRLIFYNRAKRYYEGLWLYDGSDWSGFVLLRGWLCHFQALYGGS